MIILIVIISRKFENIKDSYIIIAGFLFFIILIGVTKCTNKMWLTGRCLIPSMPLLIMMVIEIIDNLKIKKECLFQIIIIMPLIIMFGLNLNLTTTRDWNNDYSIREVCYGALKSKDNTKVLEITDNCTTHFYRAKILKEYGYDIFQENYGNAD